MIKIDWLWNLYIFYRDGYFGTFVTALFGGTRT